MADTITKPTTATASGLIKTGRGILRGVFCSSSTSGTLVIRDGIDGSGTVVVAQFSLTAGQTYMFPDMAFNTGLYITVGGTTAVTVFTK